MTHIKVKFILLY